MLKKMTEDEKAGLQVVPKAVREGAYKEHLEGLERGNAEIIPDDSIPEKNKKEPKKKSYSPADDYLHFLPKKE
jgi:hypothetical protein